MIAAVVPLKSLAAAKSRLAGVLSDTERRALVEYLLSGTIRALRDSGAIDQIALVSPERVLADRLGIVWLPDAGGLNESLAAGVEWALAQPASGVVIVPADLPDITRTDVRTIVKEPPDPPGVCLALARGGGTGALVLRPPDIIAPQFGPDSFRRHREAALARGAALRVVHLPGLALDLDTPSDLALLGKKKPPVVSQNDRRFLPLS